MNKNQAKRLATRLSALLNEGSDSLLVYCHAELTADDDYEVFVKGIDGYKPNQLQVNLLIDHLGIAADPYACPVQPDRAILRIS